MATATSAPHSDEGLIYRRVVDDVRRALTLGEIGTVTDVSERSVQNWAKGATRPDPAARERLLELKYVVDALADVYTDEGVEIWLHSPQRAFESRTALDLLRRGEFERVLLLIEQLAGGPRGKS